MKQETKEKIVAVSASVFLFVVVVFVTLGWIEVQHYIRSPTIIISKLNKHICMSLFVYHLYLNPRRKENVFAKANQY